MVVSGLVMLTVGGTTLMGDGFSIQEIKLEARAMKSNIALKRLFMKSPVDGSSWGCSSERFLLSSNWMDVKNHAFANSFAGAICGVQVLLEVIRLERRFYGLRSRLVVVTECG
jgi:hypothetical protein